MRRFSHPCRRRGGQISFGRGPLVQQIPNETDRAERLLSLGRGRGKRLANWRKRPRRRRKIREYSGRERRRGFRPAGFGGRGRYRLAPRARRQHRWIGGAESSLAETARDNECRFSFEPPTKLRGPICRAQIVW